MINIKDLSKSYKKNQVLKKLNLDIRNDEFLVILGPSGCGKTTFLRLIAGLENPNCGDIIFDDKSILNLSPKERNISMVFQNYALFPDMNVYQNIAFGLQIRKYKKEDIESIVNKVSQKLKIDKLLKRKPNELSGGEQQRVAIARAMVKNPRVYLFDEPLSNLDVNLKEDFIDLIKLVHNETHSTFIYVTHAQNEALKLADRIVVMNKGNILQIGTPKEIYQNPNCLFVARFIGEPKINIIKKDTYSIGIRPENIRIGLNENNDYISFNVKVLSSEFLGNGYIINVLLNNNRIRIFSLSNVTNEYINISILKSSILMFDKDGLLMNFNKEKIINKNNNLTLEE